MTAYTSTDGAMCRGWWGQSAAHNTPPHGPARTVSSACEPSRNFKRGCSVRHRAPSQHVVRLCNCLVLQPNKDACQPVAGLEMLLRTHSLGSRHCASSDSQPAFLLSMQLRRSPVATVFSSTNSANKKDSDPWLKQDFMPQNLLIAVKHSEVYVSPPLIKSSFNYLVHQNASCIIFPAVLLTSKVFLFDRKRNCLNKDRRDESLLVSIFSLVWWKRKDVAFISKKWNIVEKVLFSPITTFKHSPSQYWD